jgi:Ca2+-binding RTX toxin-like protein
MPWQYFIGDENDNSFWGTTDKDYIDGRGGNDFLYGWSGDDLLIGSSGNDYLDGGSGNDRLWGDEDNDYLYGGEGRDTLDGGRGDDFIEGGSGSDVIWGEYGSDTIYGGAGSDIFCFHSGGRFGYSNIDWLQDFNAFEGDMIDLSGRFVEIFGRGGLAPHEVILSTQTMDVPHIVYDEHTGALYYDASSADNIAPELFACLRPYTYLTAANFYVGY